MRTEMRTGIFGGRYELRIEDNGHSASDAGGCICSECQDLRATDGRCPTCGGSMRSAGLLSHCVGCTASGLGA